jgi:hypothetical protein
MVLYETLVLTAYQGLSKTILEYTKILKDLNVIIALSLQLMLHRMQPRMMVFYRPK